MSPISSACLDERFSLNFTHLPFYFDLSFPVFFHSSVLMHPDLHTDLDNLDTVENNLPHSAKGSLDAYDVTFSLTIWVLSFYLHSHPWAHLLESLLFFYFHLSFPVFFFSFHLLHCELYSELDNLIAMESLCYSANKGSDDACDVSTSLTGYEPNFMASKRAQRQSVSRRRLYCSMDQGNLMEKEWSIDQLVLVSQETRTVLTANFLKTPKLRKWSIDRGNLKSEIAQMHRLGLYLKNRDRWLSQNIARKMVITNSKQLMQKKSAESDIGI